jgi:hypothetical protein
MAGEIEGPHGSGDNYEKSIDPKSKLVGKLLVEHLTSEQCDAIAEEPYPDSLRHGKDRLIRVGISPETVFGDLIKDLEE